MSLPIFMSEAATVLSAPEASTSASWAARASNLLGAVTKGRFVSSAIWREGGWSVSLLLLLGERSAALLVPARA